jgi:hypothetical protein
VVEHDRTLQGACQAATEAERGLGLAQHPQILEADRRKCALCLDAPAGSRYPAPGSSRRGFSMTELLVVSFLCFMGGAALRRWPDKVETFMGRYDGSLLFIAATTHRALIYATSIALTGLSLLAVVAARYVG